MKWDFGELQNGGIRICKCGDTSLEDEMHMCPLGDETLTENPILEIEDKKTWTDFGKQSLCIYRGALEEGATEREAILLVTAFYAGAPMFQGVTEHKNDNDEHNN